MLLGRLPGNRNVLHYRKKKNITKKNISVSITKKALEMGIL